MLSGYRLLIAAVCGIAIFIALGTGAFFGALYAPHYGQQSAYTANRSISSGRYTSNQLDRNRMGLPYFAERIASGPDPKNADEREKRDLAAQESTSVWAFWMLLVAGVSVVVTMIGTGFLLWQIILTREAIADTGRATEAMQEANAIARKSAYLDQRAWIIVDVAPAGKLTISGRVHSIVRIDLTNIGKLPAHNVATWATLFTDGTDRQSVITDLMQRVSSMRSYYSENQLSRTIMPGQTISLRPDVLCDPTQTMIGRIIACAQYLISEDEVEHRTIASFDLTGMQEDGSQRVIIPSEGDIPLDRLLIEPSGFAEAT